LTTSCPAIVYKRLDGGNAGPGDPASPRSGARCVLRTQWNNDRWMGPLCEVLIMWSLIGQSVITCRVVIKMSLVTSLLTTCEICECSQRSHGTG
ncbi:unnamed protein product, partial [Staurois parvus]